MCLYLNKETTALEVLFCGDARTGLSLFQNLENKFLVVEYWWILNLIWFFWYKVSLAATL